MQQSIRKILSFIIIIVLSLASSCDFACAKSVKKKKKNQNQQQHKPDLSLLKPLKESCRYSGFVVNIDTGEIIYSHNAKIQRHPASLTKMMTLYLTFDAISRGRLRMNQPLVLSHAAAKQPSCNMNLVAGATIDVKQAIYSLVVKSANDISVVLSEAIAGTEENFVREMNKTAKKLGLRDTVFCNSHGLHNKNQVTTAYDMAILALALQKHYPQYYHMFSKTSFNYKGRTITGHNRVLKRYQWADGGKTGYIKASGYNIVTTTRSPEGRFVAVVMGCDNNQIRDDHTIALLQNAYSTLRSKKMTSRANVTSLQMKKQTSRT